MSLEVTKQELLKQAIYLNKLYATTRNQEYKDQETRIRRIVVELELLVIGTSNVTNLDSLSDVTISAPANAQVLTYNSTTSQWENQTPAGGGGGGDMSKSTYDVDNDGVVDSAERTEIIVRNSTGVTLTKGQVVYLSGATGNRPNAVLSQAHTEATSSKTIGIVVANIANNSDGYVATNGTLHDLDTSAFADGAAVWLSAATAGGMTSTIPAEPNHTVFIGYIARSHPTQGRLVILIQNGYELNELHGVQIASEANNDLLTYESSTGLWKNKTFSAIFGGTPLVSVPNLAQVTTAGNTTTNEITVNNVVIGGGAGGSNTFIGQSITSRSLGTLDENTFVGFAAGANFIGNSNGNTALGWLSLNGAANNAEYNTAIGARALSLNTSQYNTGLGYSAGYNNTSGSQNVYIGYNAGLGITTGSNNTIVGASITGLASNLANTLILGAANSIRIYSPSTGNILIGTTTDAGQKLQVSGNIFIKGTDSLSSTKVFEVQNGAGASVMDFRNATYAFFGCGQGGGSNSGFIFRYDNTSYVQFTGYNYGAGSGAYKPILMDTDIVGRGQGIFINFGVSTNTPPNSDTEFAVRGRGAGGATYAARFRDSSNNDVFAIKDDGQLETLGITGYTGTLSIPTNPPGSNTITITNGLITNIA